MFQMQYPIQPQANGINGIEHICVGHTRLLADVVWFVASPQKRYRPVRDRVYRCIKMLYNYFINYKNKMPKYASHAVKSALAIDLTKEVSCL
jgi:hypothetical protein